MIIEFSTCDSNGLSSASQTRYSKGTGAEKCDEARFAATTKDNCFLFRLSIISKG
jgi:hypothetical protein